MVWYLVKGLPCPMGQDREQHLPYLCLAKDGAKKEFEWSTVFTLKQQGEDKVKRVVKKRAT